MLTDKPCVRSLQYIAADSIVVRYNQPMGKLKGGQINMCQSEQMCAKHLHKHDIHRDIFYVLLARVRLPQHNITIYLMLPRGVTK